MAEFTIIIDNWGHIELEDYLRALKGIHDVSIKNESLLEVTVKYNSKLITPKIIRAEILLFLDSLRMPSVYAFDKHPKNKTEDYTIIRDDICCEFCLKGTIEDLFETDGIEKVDNNYYEGYLSKDYDKREKIKINIKYNPEIISLKQMKELEDNLNI